MRWKSTTPASRETNLVAVPVGRPGRQFDFTVCLRQQLLGFGCMATHVVLVGTLRNSDFLHGLFDENRRGGQVRVPVWIHVLSNGYTTSDKSEDQRAGQKHITKFHEVSD